MQGAIGGPLAGFAAIDSWAVRRRTRGNIGSTCRRFRLAESVFFDQGADTHAIDSAFRIFFDAHHAGPSPDECLRGSHNFPRGHNRKSDLRSYSEPLTNHEVKTLSRNIARPSQKRFELPRCRLRPDFNLKG